ncbi:hypothetical protein HPP92_011828 [Vanilla planifolia]|uniref:Rho-GAP domain-containing protein n=1 Tax=Vanilla planifolia TaxID=51239 RepID=A0A835V261_VANPL|nr:hypothetical protein HPP92_011828 [Vanilla planifolia]
MTGVAVVLSGCRGGGGGKRAKRETERQWQLSLITLMAATIKKSMAQCHLREEEQAIDIGWPTEVHHIAHVTFDRFHGFLGLPIEFEVEVPRRAPSASVNVFGVSPESMQCGYDSKGNSVPTILLLMQERLYSQGGLKAEGIFRINPENEQEKELRDQLSKGNLPDDIDVHCLASLIKAWFRELPEGVMDTLSPGQVLQCETEDDFAELVNQLPPTDYALFNWVIELMADVVEEEQSNKMNVRNIAMVFAPNMTQLSDPLTSLMHAVQVMNLLKILILKTIRERGEQATEVFWPSPPSSQEATEDESYEKKKSYESSSSDGLSEEEEEEEETAMGVGGARDDCCSVNEQIVEEIESGFLMQLDWKEETRFCSPSSTTQGSSTPKFESKEDSSVDGEVSSRSLAVRDAVRIIEGYSARISERNHERMEIFGTIVVRDAVKLIEGCKGLKSEFLEETKTENEEMISEKFDFLIKIA